MTVAMILFTVCSVLLTVLSLPAPDNQPVFSFDWHPTNENRLLTVSSTSVCDIKVYERITLVGTLAFPQIDFVIYVMQCISWLGSLRA